LVVRLREYVPLQEEEVADPESERFRFFEAVSATLNELSDGSFLLLVLDDLHWADEPTLLLLRHVLRGADPTKFGIVGMYIDTEVPVDHRLRGLQADLRAEHAVDTVHLEGLQRPAVEELVRAAGLAPGALAAQLFSLTDGNPLFVDEMVRQLRDHEAAADDALVPPDLDPPEAIRELVGRRVSRQPEDVIYLLQAAAVAGPTFEAAIVGVAAELTPDQRLEALDRAEESRLLRRVGDAGDRFAFTHALVRGAIYGELLRGRRVRYHHKIAVATEKAHADAVDSYVNELAHHFSMGAALADAQKAVTYCTAAGERALRLLAFEEAVGHFARGLEVAEQYGEHDPSVRCDLLIALAEAQNRAGDAVRADANFERAAALARTMGDAERLATVALRAGPLSYLGIVDTNPEQLKMLEEALFALSDEDSHLRAMVMARLGLFVAYSSGLPAAGARERACMRCGASTRHPSAWRPAGSWARSRTMSATSCWPCTGTCGGSGSCWCRATSTPCTRRWHASRHETPVRSIHCRPRTRATWRPCWRSSRGISPEPTSSGPVPWRRPRGTTTGSSASMWPSCSGRGGNATSWRCSATRSATRSPRRRPITRRCARPPRSSGPSPASQTRR
jgi:hypothetical protein